MCIVSLCIDTGALPITNILTSINFQARLLAATLAENDPEMQEAAGVTLTSLTDAIRSPDYRFCIAQTLLTLARFL